jgi:hypothetical protein
VSVKRAVTLALVLALGIAANACRRIVDLTPFRDSSVTDDGGLDAALGDAFGAFDDAGFPGDVGHD